MWQLCELPLGCDTTHKCREDYSNVIQLHFVLKTLNMDPLLITFMTFASQKEKQKYLKDKQDENESCWIRLYTLMMDTISAGAAGRHVPVSSSSDNYPLILSTFSVIM
ncbi:hypothetical protein DPMN_147025 [Dreissena polymorpha]|uniref:Uncharacterized protein n=1 Tax=Dreissena polymorpha TaxID=45954 RepID=A0A9D4FBF9_DREPO|nr:hypothetical protein DPMN_147025 [Dreissena polymorpha]